MSKKSTKNVTLKDILIVSLLVIVVGLAGTSYALYKSIQNLKTDESSTATKAAVTKAEVNALLKCVNADTKPCEIIFN